MQHIIKAVSDALILGLDIGCMGRISVKVQQICVVDRLPVLVDISHPIMVFGIIIG